MRPLAILVVMVGVVLLALGTWLILRASIGAPRKPRPTRPAPRPAPPPAPQVADRPRTPIAFPPAAVARRSVPVEDAPWQRPELEMRRPEDDPVTEPVHEPLVDEEPARDEVPAPGPADERVGPDEQLAEEAAALDLPAGAAAWGGPVPPAAEVPAAEVPAAEVPAAEVPAAEVPAAEVPAAEVPVEDVPAEDLPVEDVPVEDVPAEEVPAEDVPAEDLAAEDVPVDEGLTEEPPAEPEPVTAEEPAPQDEGQEEPPSDEAPAEEAREPRAAAAPGPEEAAPPGGAGVAGAAGAAAGWAARREADDRSEVAPRSSFAESLAAQADESHEQPGPKPPVPPGDAVTPMGTVLGGSGAYPPLPPPQTPLPPPAPPAEQEADPLQDWAEERPTGPGHQLGPVVGQQGPLPDLGATPPGGETDDDWEARFGALAEQFGEPRPDQPQEHPTDQPWSGPPAPEEPSSPFGQQPPGRDDRYGQEPAGPRDEPAGRRDEPGGRGDEPDGRRDEPGGRGDEPGGRRGEPFGRPYGQQPGPPPPYGQQPGPPPYGRQPGPPPPYRPTGPEPVRPRDQGPETPRAASRQAGTRSRRGRPEDPRQAAVYDALTINEHVLDEVWTSPSVDVLKVVSSIVVNALDAYEDDPAEYADWVAVHRTGNCDCH
jgi:hypothetical protein